MDPLKMYCLLNMGDIPACYVIVYQSVHLGDILQGDNPFQKKDGPIFWEKEIKMNWPTYAPTVLWNLYRYIWLDVF